VFPCCLISSSSHLLLVFFFAGQTRLRQFAHLSGKRKGHEIEYSRQCKSIRPGSVYWAAVKWHVCVCDLMWYEFQLPYDSIEDSKRSIWPPTVLSSGEGTCTCERDVIQWQLYLSLSIVLSVWQDFDSELRPSFWMYSNSICDWWGTRN